MGQDLQLFKSGLRNNSLACVEAARCSTLLSLAWATNRVIYGKVRFSTACLHLLVTAHGAVDGGGVLRRRSWC